MPHYVLDEMEIPYQQLALDLEQKHGQIRSINTMHRQALVDQFNTNPPMIIELTTVLDQGVLSFCTNTCDLVCPSMSIPSASERERAKRGGHSMSMARHCTRNHSCLVWVRWYILSVFSSQGPDGITYWMGNINLRQPRRSGKTSRSVRCRCQSGAQCSAAEGYTRTRRWTSARSLQGASKHGRAQ